MTGLGIVLGATTAYAQAYPAKTVRMVIGFPAGGSADIVGRVMAQKLTENIGQQVVVDNRPGASGNIAWEFTARAERDGYTIVNATPGIATNLSLYRKVNYKLEDFTPIMHVGEAPLLVMVHPSLPVAGITDLAKLAKAKPGAIRYGSAGAGSSSHLANEVFRLMAGVEILHVPYKGAAPAMQDVMSGQTEMTSVPIAESIQHVRAKRLKALGQTGSKRSSIAADIPTLDEAGIKGYNVATWYVVLGPAKMPREIVTRLHGELDKVLKDPQILERYSSMGVNISVSSQEQAVKFVQSEHARWAKIVKASGMKAD
ncbi:MAG TPA: tripartite tricarboxylate transporter substrate binding protein [Burkholderiales bacterium]|nr:tripartite tricarboxylate transporter substrate binding protein [Burkholderiales bacterium]